MLKKRKKNLKKVILYFLDLVNSQIFWSLQQIFIKNNLFIMINIEYGGFGIMLKRNGKRLMKLTL